MDFFVFFIYLLLASVIPHVSWVGSVLQTDPAQPLVTVGEELDYLLQTYQIDR